MANKEHLEILGQGFHAWNKWREHAHKTSPDLSRADLRSASSLGNANFGGVDLSGTNLGGVDLRWVFLHKANLTGASLAGADCRGVQMTSANLSGADLRKAEFGYAYLHKSVLAGADLREAVLFSAQLTSVDLTGAHLQRANLCEAHLGRAQLDNANLTGANLQEAVLVNTSFRNAILTGCRVHGISAWNLMLHGARQSDLVITAEDEPTLTVDNLEVAQFIYLLLHNEKIRDVIDTVGRKGVLILGRFTPKRKTVLNAIREELRKRGYVPILFDFDKPSRRSLTETVSTLAHIVRFVIADITDAKSIPQELQRIVPGMPSVPVQPLIAASQYEYAMFKDFLDYPWVLPPYRYASLRALLSSLDKAVISPAVRKSEQVVKRRKMLERDLARSNAD